VAHTYEERGGVATIRALEQYSVRPLTEIPAALRADIVFATPTATYYIAGA